MDNRLKIAIVGVGWAGSRHAEAIAELRKVDDRVEVGCFVDSDSEHLKETAAKYGVSKIYSSLDKALADPAINAIDIATPRFCQNSALTMKLGRPTYMHDPCI